MKAIILCFFALIGAIFADPNASFLTCCKNKGVQNSCQPYCSYDKNPDVVLKAFKAGKCNFDTDGPSYYQCLENLKDNRGCCEFKGVGSDPVLSYCLDKCDGTKPIKPNHKYFNCKSYAQSIYDCGKNSHWWL